MRRVTLDQALNELDTALADGERKEQTKNIVRAASEEILNSPRSVDFLRLHVLDKIHALYVDSSETEDVRKVDDFMLWMSGRREAPHRSGEARKFGLMPAGERETFLGMHMRVERQILSS